MDNLVKGVQCYELFGGIALKIHSFSFFFHFQLSTVDTIIYFNSSLINVGFMNQRC